jgi:integrase
MGHATMLYPTMWLRGRTYWLRRVVPLDLRERLGLTEVRRSLRTKDHDEAKRRWKIESIKVDRLFEDARRGAVVQPTLPRNVSEVDRDYYVDRLVDDDQGDRRLPDHVRRRYLAIVQDDGSPRCSEVLERWVKERQPPSKTEAEWRKNFARFIALGLDGQDIPIRQVTRSHVRTFKDRLLVAKGKNKEAAISPRTVLKIITAVKSVFSWAVNNGHIEGVNPFQGITVANVKGRAGDRPRLPFDTGNLKKLFSVEREGAANYWLPYLALYQGARLEELAQLRVEDIKAEDGVHYLDIHGRDGRKVKTATSERRVPLHPEIIRLGFLNHVEAQRTAGEERVFSELSQDTHGAWSGAYSKRFGRHLRAIGITDRRLTFHSLRHSWASAARAAMSEEHRHELGGWSGGGVGRGYGSARILEAGVDHHVLRGSVRHGEERSY